jgi:hypothetical protein
MKFKYVMSFFISAVHVQNVFIENEALGIRDMWTQALAANLGKLNASSENNNLSISAGSSWGTGNPNYVMELRKAMGRNLLTGLHRPSKGHQLFFSFNWEFCCFVLRLVSMATCLASHVRQDWTITSQDWIMNTPDAKQKAIISRHTNWKSYELSREIQQRRDLYGLLRAENKNTFKK